MEGAIFMVRAVLPIQKIIHVTKPTATSESVPPRISWAWKLRPYGPQVSDGADPERHDQATPDADPELGEHVRAAELDDVGDRGW